MIATASLAAAAFDRAAEGCSGARLAARVGIAGGRSVGRLRPPPRAEHRRGRRRDHARVLGRAGARCAIPPLVRAAAARRRAAGPCAGAPELPGRAGSGGTCAPSSSALLARARADSISIARRAGAPDRRGAPRCGSRAFARQPPTSSARLSPPPSSRSTSRFNAWRTISSARRTRVADQLARARASPEAAHLRGRDADRRRRRAAGG